MDDSEYDAANDADEELEVIDLTRDSSTDDEIEELDVIDLTLANSF
jgi:hypothetical protein